MISPSLTPRTRERRFFLDEAEDEGDADVDTQVATDRWCGDDAARRRVLILSAVIR